MYHIRGWGKFNRHYGDFCTGADILATTLLQFSLAAVAVQLSTQARSGKLLGNLGGLTSTS